jgi:hypothetical protein
MFKKLTPDAIVQKEQLSVQIVDLEYDYTHVKLGKLSELPCAVCLVDITTITHRSVASIYRLEDGNVILRNHRDSVASTEMLTTIQGMQYLEQEVSVYVIVTRGVMEVILFFEEANARLASVRVDTEGRVRDELLRLSVPEKAEVLVFQPICELSMFVEEEEEKQVVKCGKRPSII